MVSDNMKAEDLKGVYQEFANLLGLDAAEKIHAAFRGQQITFPVQLYNPDFIARLILSEYDGHNVKALAAKYGYSEKWIRILIRKHKR